jgi:hypothetical protein
MKFLLATAVLISATSAEIQASYAFGDAPWCAVINIGTGEVYWDCQYRTFEACVPNVIAGNRGFCNVNPYGPDPAAPVTHKRYRQHHKDAQR